MIEDKATEKLKSRAQDLADRQRCEEHGTIESRRRPHATSTSTSAEADEEMAVRRKARGVSVQYMLSTRPPFSADWRKTYHATLAAALGVAWRKYSREWSVDSISHERSVVINSEGLMQAFNLMDNLKRESPERPLIEMSEQVIQGMDWARDAAKGR